MLAGHNTNQNTALSPEAIRTPNQLTRPLTIKPQLSYPLRASCWLPLIRLFYFKNNGIFTGLLLDREESGVLSLHCKRDSNQQIIIPRTRRDVYTKTDRHPFNFHLSKSFAGNQPPPEQLNSRGQSFLVRSCILYVMTHSLSFVQLTSCAH